MFPNPHGQNKQPDAHQRRLRISSLCVLKVVKTHLGSNRPIVWLSIHPPDADRKHNHRNSKQKHRKFKQNMGWALSTLLGPWALAGDFLHSLAHCMSMHRINKQKKTFQFAMPSSQGHVRSGKMLYNKNIKKPRHKYASSIGRV